MRKKIAYVGVAIMLIAIVVFFATGLLLQSTIGSKLVRYNVTVGAHNYTYVKIMQNTTLASMVYEISSKPANLYVMNSSVFDGFQSYLVANPSASGYSYIGSRISQNDSQLNTTHGIVYLYNTPSNAVNKTNLLYVVLDNTEGSTSTTSALNATVLFVKFNAKQGLAYSVIYIICILAFIVGIAVTVFGLIKKEAGLESDAAPQTPQDQKYVDSLYKNVDSEKGGNKKPKSKKTKKKKDDE